MNTQVLTNVMNGLINSTPSWVFYLLGVLVALTVIAKIIGHLRFFSVYKKRGRLLTPTEVKSYQVIEPVCRSMGLMLMAQVRIADVINVSAKNKRFWKAFTKISSKHVDFVVVKPDFSIVSAIEIDDKSHEKKERRERDVFVNKVFESAGVPLLRCVPGDEKRVIQKLQTLRVF